MGCECGKHVDRLAVAHESMQRELARLAAALATPHERYERRRRYQVVITADGSGNGTMSLGPPPAGNAWYIERISSNASAGTPSIGIFVGPQNETSVSFRMDFSPAAADNIADQSQPIYVGPGEYLTIQWTGATASAVLSACVQVCVYRVGLPQGAAGVPS